MNTTPVQELLKGDACSAKAVQLFAHKDKAQSDLLRDYAQMMRLACEEPGNQLTESQAEVMARICISALKIKMYTQEGRNLQLQAIGSYMLASQLVWQRK
jgi:hypothetical protein